MTIQWVEPGRGRKPGTGSKKKHPLLFRPNMNNFRMLEWLQKRIKNEYGQDAAKFIEECILNETGWDQPDDQVLYEYDLKFKTELERQLTNAETDVTETVIRKQLTEVKKRIERYESESE